MATVICELGPAAPQVAAESSFRQGAVVPVRMKFLDEPGRLVDPLDVQVIWTPPAEPAIIQNLSGGTVERMGLGLYTASLELSSPGEWQIECVGVGSYAARRLRWFTVD